VFLPELAQHCDELYAIDQHAKTAEVALSLKENHVAAQLASGSALNLPYGSDMFDCIVAVSCLEYMDPFERAAGEMRRILKSDGCLVFVTPGYSALIDFGHYLLTGCRAAEHYGKRREHLVPTLLKTFVVEAALTMPHGIPRSLTFYRGFRLSPR
jgi:SAM-dependent methyltransferase